MKPYPPKAMLYLGSLLLFVITPADAAVEANTTAEFILEVFVPCAAGGVGEVVDLSGRLHTLVTFTINGNEVSGLLHFQPQGLGGTGETTGARYRGTGVTKSSFSGSLQNGQFNTTFVNNFRIIGQGPGNNFLLHETAHITINADGTVTVNHDNLSTECK
jgi:hypothetical protein